VQRLDFVSQEALFYAELEAAFAKLAAWLALDWVRGRHGRQEDAI